MIACPFSREAIQKGTQEFEYDGLNRLVFAEGLTGRTTYVYDVLGRRLGKTEDGQTTRYVYSGHRVIEERDGMGALKKEYIYSNGIDEAMVSHKEGVSERYYYHNNHIGSVTELTDAQGVKLESIARLLSIPLEELTFKR